MKVVLCVKKTKPYLVDERKVRYHNFVLGDNSVLKSNEKDLVLNGKIVAECDFEVEEIEHYIHYEPELDVGIVVYPEFECDAYRTKTLGHFELLKESCLKDYSLPNITVSNELDDYLKGKNGYAIHIKNLNVFDKSRELKQYFLTKITRGLTYGFYNTPEIENERTIVISVTSQEACNILNHKQDILIRRNVLKEMK